MERLPSDYSRQMPENTLINQASALVDALDTDPSNEDSWDALESFVNTYPEIVTEMALPKQVEFRICQAVANLNRPVEAISLLQSYLKKYPDDTKGHLQLGRLYPALITPARSSEQIDVISRASITSMRKGIHERDALDGLIRCVIDLISICYSDEPFIQVKMCRLVLKELYAASNGNLDLFYRVCAREDVQQFTELLQDIALNYATKGEQKGSKELYECLLELKPNDASIKKMLMHLYIQSQEPEKALKCIDDLAAMQTTKPKDLLYFSCVCHILLDNLQAAQNNAVLYNASLDHFEDAAWPDQIPDLVDLIVGQKQLDQASDISQDLLRGATGLVKEVLQNLYNWTQME